MVVPVMLVDQVVSCASLVLTGWGPGWGFSYVSGSWLSPQHNTVIPGNVENMLKGFFFLKDECCIVLQEDEYLI